MSGERAAIYTHRKQSHLTGNAQIARGLTALLHLAGSCLFLFGATLALLAAPENPAKELPSTAAFAEWLISQQRPGDQKAAPVVDLPRGLELSQKRAKELRGLMEVDANGFLSHVLPQEAGNRLPKEIRPFVERRVQGRGFYGVYCDFQKPEAHQGGSTSHRHSEYRREAVFEGRVYQAYVPHSWKEARTTRNRALDGYVIEDAIVLTAESASANETDTNELVTLDAPSLSGPNKLLYLIARFSDETSDPISDATALSQMGAVNTFWLDNSGGAVSIRGLVNPGQVMDIVHITLPQPRSYVSTYNTSLGVILADARNAAAAQGYDYTDYNLDVLVTSDPGFSYAGRAYIGAQGLHLVQGYTSLRTAGHELGHNLGLYHANYWRTDATLPFGKDTIPGGYVADIANSERIEYGHYFSLMSAQYGAEIDDPTKPHYAPAEKTALGWLSGSEVRYVSSSATNRLYRMDHRNTLGTPRALRIETPATDYLGYGRLYWLSYRYAPWNTAQSWLRNGLQMDVCRSSYGSDGAIMLDMTPFSSDVTSPFYDPNNKPSGWWMIDNSDKLDGALIVGRTYSDATAGIHITPIATGNNGENEEYIDVVVHVGTFPGNRPPIVTSLAVATNMAALNQTVGFSVTASDADGDALAYAWDFDQVQVWTSSGLNSPTAAKSWSTAGEYRVTITVSDMKGGVTSESAIITVGSPIHNRQIWGRVVWGGWGVGGARVWTTVAGSLRQCWTDSDGSYGLTDLPSTNSYTVLCARDGLTFTAQFSNPVTVSAGNAYGIDYYANEPLPNGGGGTTYAASGQVTYAGKGVAGAEVRGGGLLAVTDASGNFRLTNLLDGSYTLVPKHDLWGFSPGLRNVTISSADSTGNNFARVALCNITGRIDGVPAGFQDLAPTLYLSNGRSVQATRAGTGNNRYWSYNLSSVPEGSYSVSAELAGYSIAPTNFANPLLVTEFLTEMNFHGSEASVAGAIAGRITEGGRPHPGVKVEVRVGGSLISSTTTDADGCYRISNLASGTYTVLPSLEGHAFSPTSATVLTIPANGINFVATGTNSPPVISTVNANPSPVPSISSPATLSATASGHGPLTYRWDATAWQAPVSYSDNDSASAASTVVGFRAAGRYTFRVRVTDTNGFWSSASVDLIVSAGAGSLAVTPYETKLAGGETVAFHADAWDALGNRIVLVPVWSTTGGGEISTDGSFTATLPGGPFAVVATAGGLSATGQVWVTGVAASTVSLTALDNTLMESATNTGRFRIARSGSTNGSLTVHLSVQGTATLGIDYTASGADSFSATSAAITIPAGLNSRDITITPVDDAAVEGPETIQLSVLPDPAYTVPSASNAVVTFLDDELPPTILTHPQSVLVNVGASATFTVLATGSPPLLYQWYFNQTNPIANATNTTLTLSNVVDLNQGFYSVVVSNGFSVSSAYAQLRVNHLPVPASPWLVRWPQHGLKTPLSSLLGSDPDGDPLTLDFLDALSGGGGAVLLQEAWVLYLPPPSETNFDTFGYLVSDGRGGTSAGTVTVSVAADTAPSVNLRVETDPDQTARIHGSGIPGRAYQIEYSESLALPDWHPLGTVTADDTGLIEFFDQPPGGAPPRYYRTFSP